MDSRNSLIWEKILTDNQIDAWVNAGINDTTVFKFSSKEDLVLAFDLMRKNCEKRPCFEPDEKNKLEIRVKNSELKLLEKQKELYHLPKKIVKLKKVGIPVVKVQKVLTRPEFKKVLSFKKGEQDEAQKEEFVKIKTLVSQFSPEQKQEFLLHNCKQNEIQVHEKTGLGFLLVFPDKRNKNFFIRDFLVEYNFKYKSLDTAKLAIQKVG